MTKIHIITFGCSLNVSDSENMAGLLKEAGHTLTEKPEDAELIIVNSCTVKNLAEKKFFKSIDDAKRKNQKVVAAGCVPQAEHSLLKDQLKDISVLGTKNLDNVVHVVEETLEGNVIHLVGHGSDRRLGIPKIRRNHIIGIVPVSEGCLGNCTYCKTKHARGKLRSYPIEDITKEVRSAVDEGCKEIWLTSQDCGCYGTDIKTNMIALLEAVLNIEGDFKVRLGMANPNFLIPIVDDIIDLFKNNKDKLFRFIHIPVQSGNNRILQLMNRFYTREHFIELCRRLRTQLPDIAIATDIICGFPTETDAEFEDTLDLLKTVKPDVINRSRFWPRPGTPAVDMEQLHGRVTNARSRKLNALLRDISLERNRFWIGWKGNILIDECGKGESSIGRNYAYKPVVLKEVLEVGSQVDVEIGSVEVFCLNGIMR